MKRSIEDAQQRLAEKLLSRKDVSAVGIGADNGDPCLKVYLSGSSSRKSIPDRYDGHPVRVVGGGPFRAQGNGSAGPAAGGA